MKYLLTFKLYENKKNIEPQVGDYVICRDSGAEIKRIFTLVNIGQIISNNNRTYTSDSDSFPGNYQYVIHYETAPEGLFGQYMGTNNRQMTREEIIFYSPNKEDCEMYLTATKYNL